jgi:hypothetical protein
VYYNVQCINFYVWRLQVEGVLVAVNAYSTPFEPVCVKCNSPAVFFHFDK